jgi:hypothetical protein
VNAVTKLSRIVMVPVATLSLASVLLADDDNVIRQPSVAVQDVAKSANDLRKEKDEAQKQADANAQKAAEAEKEVQQLKQELAQKAATPPQQQSPQVSTPVSAVPVTSVATGVVGISRVHVTTDKKDGEWTADVTSAITLNSVANVPFTYQAQLVTADGKVHTDVQGRPYSASREVSTGDEADTDRYTVTIPLGGLFTSRPPDLYVQARVIDSSGKVVTSAPLQYFPMPK